MNHAEQLSLDIPAITPNGGWNPRYVAYCADVSGLDPIAQLARDREAYPGGCMCDYILWIGRRWREWRKAKGAPPGAPLTAVDHAEFDVWLSGRGWALL